MPLLIHLRSQDASTTENLHFLRNLFIIPIFRICTYPPLNFLRTFLNSLEQRGILNRYFLHRNSPLLSLPLARALDIQFQLLKILAPCHVLEGKYT